MRKRLSGPAKFFLAVAAVMLVVLLILLGALSGVRSFIDNMSTVETGVVIWKTVQAVYTTSPEAAITATNGPDTPEPPPPPTSSPSPAE